jgi:hypothetical protein
MMRHSRGRRGLVLGLLTLLALTLVACGGGEETVTVTQTVSSEPGGNGNGKPTKEDVVPENGAVAGYVDNVSVESDSMVLSGWAASSDLSQAASAVTAEVNGQSIAEAVPALKREDVVEALGEPGLAESGFELRLPLDSVECGAPAAGVKVVASLDGKSSVLLYGEGIKDAVAEAC